MPVEISIAQPLSPSVAVVALIFRSKVILRSYSASQNLHSQVFVTLGYCSSSYFQVQGNFATSVTVPVKISIVHPDFVPAEFRTQWVGSVVYLQKRNSLHSLECSTILQCCPLIDDLNHV